MDKICLRKLVNKGYLVFDEVECESSCTAEELAMLVNSYSSLGYAIDKEGLKRLSKLDSFSLKKFYYDNYDVLNDVSGANFNHRVFYKNFPKMDNLSELETVVRAILHYLTATVDSDGFMNQDIEDFERKIIHNEEKRVLKFITTEEARKLLIKYVEDLFESEVSIPYSEDDLIWSVMQYCPLDIHVKNIPFKENIGHYFAFLYRDREDSKKLSEVISKETLNFIKTPTDLLRVYAALSNGDVMLRRNFRFKSLERSVRRIFLSILNDMAEGNIYIYDDFARHEFLWKKAFEKLHVGEFENKYPYIVEVAKKFRNDDYKTFYSKLDSLINNQVSYINLLKTRPGEFARRLDMLIRNDNYDLEYTLKEFKSIAKSISTTLLLQLWEFFKNRNLYNTRIIKINRERSVIYKEIEDNRKVIEQSVIDRVVCMIEEALVEIYSTYDNKGKVYIDESVKAYCLPRNSRNGSAQNKTLTFGTRVKLDPSRGQILRFFTHFKNAADDRVDIDLTAEFFNKNFLQLLTIGWHSRIVCAEMNSYYSGDITSAPEGASEFIDVDLNEARKVARYAVITNSVYTGQDFCDIPECFSGVMFLNEMGKEGEIFNPEFVEHKFDLTQKGSNQNVAFAVDLKTMELIWIDSPFSHMFSGIVAAVSSGVVLTLKDALKEHMNLYDFFMLHKNHIEIVDNKEDADIIISDSDDATLKPFDVANIAANWL